MAGTRKIVLCFDFPPVGRTLHCLEAPGSCEIWFLSMFALFQSASNVSGNFEPAMKGLHYYHLEQRRFLDPENTMDDEAVPECSTIIASVESDTRKLDSMVTMREATLLEMEALKIRDGN